MARIKAGIVGAAGYTGGEMLRVLVSHPHVEIAFAFSRSNAGKAVAHVHADLAGDTDLTFDDKPGKADVVFLCLGHGESKVFLRENQFDASTKIIDLSQDFRLGEKSGARDFVYGLPEWQSEKIRGAENVANPGCFATAIQLGLLPLAKAGKLTEVFSTGITGSTGAGQKLQETTHFTWRANNVSPYKVLTHQHMGEVLQTLQALQPGFDKPVNFIPWRGDFTRGILVSSLVSTNLIAGEAVRLYKDYYREHPFTIVSDDVVNLKQVVNTNKCMIHVEKQGDKLVVHSVLDNLLKGASGQAVQNMNLMFGLDEAEGLRLKGIAF